MKQLSTNRYQKRALLGEGGMGRVSLAYDTIAEREVALKEILVAGASAAEFKQEFWWMTRLRHPNLVEVFDFGSDDAGHPFFTMEVVTGQPLNAELPLSEDTARSVLVQLARVLRHIHHQGLVHGDIKGDNMRLLPDGTIKLMDFGLMARAGQAVVVRGTPAYMAPEMIQQARVDQRADLYAVGCLAYELLTGRLPFVADSTTDLLRAHLDETPLPLTRFRKDLDPSWNKVVLRLLAKEPQKRYQSAAELLEALGEASQDEDGTLLVSPFVGRDAELSIFGRALDRMAEKREGGALWVSGPAGSGKSRLLDEFAFKSQLAQALVLRGVAGPGAGTPYEPFLQVLRQAWPDLSRRVPALLEAHGPALHHMLPDLATMAAAHRLEPLEEKLRLQGAIADLLLALAHQQGVVIMLDHWETADPLSRELLTVLRRRLEGQRVLWVVAGQGAPEADQPAVTLKPLERAELGVMLGAMLGVESVPDDFLTQIAELTSGAPYAVEALLNHLVSNKRLPRDHGRWVLSALPPEALPAGIHEIVASRLADLSPTAGAVLRFASVIGREFELELLFRLMPDVGPEALYEALATLESGQLLTHVRGAYQVAQAHLADALLAGLAPEELRALHTQVAEALEETVEHTDSEGADLSDALVVRLAYHFLAGDRPVKAIVYALKAAQRTAALYANDQARELLEKGWTVLQTQADVPDPFRIEYLTLKGDLHRIASEFGKSEACYVEALPGAERLERPELVAHILVGHGLVKQMVSEYEPSLELFRQALVVCRQLTEAREELRCLGAMGRVYYYAGDRHKSQATYEEALARAREVADKAYEGECLAFLGLLLVSTEPEPGVDSQVEAGLDYLRQAISIKQAVGDKRGLNDSYMLMGNAQLALGKLPEAEASFAQNQAICREIGAVEDEIFSHLNLGLVASERGDHPSAIVHIREAKRLAEPRKTMLPLGFAACLEARSLLALGELARPLEMLGESLNKARELENRYWELFGLVYLIETQLKLGLLVDAETSLLEALSAEASTGITEYGIALQISKATLAMRQGNFEPAEAGFKEALARAEAKGAQVTATQATLGLAELTLFMGLSTEAITWAERAMSRAADTGAEGLYAECCFMHGRASAVAGDLNEADRFFLRAQETAERLNLVDLLARATYQRGVLQFPSPQAQKLLKRAQELMVNQVAGLNDKVKDVYLGSEGRYPIFMGDHPALASAAPEEAPDEKSDVQFREARAALAQQRVWLDEMQHTNDLLLKQLEFSKVIARSTEAEDVTARALALMLEITKAERAELLAFEGKRLTVRARKHHTGPRRIDEDWTHYDRLVGEAVATSELRYLSSTEDDPDTYGFDQGRAVLVAPLTEDDQTTGAVLVLGPPDETGQLMKAEVEAVRVLADQLSSALRNIRVQNEMREKTSRLEMLYMLSSSVTSTLVMEEVLDLVLKLSLEITKADRGFLVLADENGELECRAARNAKGPLANDDEREAFSRSICRRVLDTGDAICVEDTLDDDILRHQKSIQDLSLRTVMCVPLKVKQKYLGVLYVDSRVVVNTFTNRDLDLLRSIASQASIALENARLYTLATVDGLTKLFFRSHFEQRMREELVRAQRYGLQLAYLMMDIDHFKKFNDTYGHAVGDEVLRHVAGVIKETVRQDLDIPCRYGGEEMVVLLPETDEAGAHALAERIRKAIDETPLDTEEHKGLHVTISIGVSCFPKHAATGLDLMEYADQALYTSKRNGRNRVTVYQPGIPSEA